MLEKLPAGLGHALTRVRPGLQELVVNRQDISSTAETPLSVTSTAFANGGAMPTRYTADGERLSPPLEWSGVPETAAAAVLLIEDADSPTPHPLVHAIVYDLAPDANRLEEGALPGPAGGDGALAMGRNSFRKAEYLPPDPPPGHGPHRYAFEVFALDTRPNLDGIPGRGALTDAMRSHVLAKGCLIGVYERM